VPTNLWPSAFDSIYVGFVDAAAVWVVVSSITNFFLFCSILNFSPLAVGKLLCHRLLERVGFYLIVEEFKTPWYWWALGRLLVALFLPEICVFECVVVLLYVANLCSAVVVPILIPCGLASLVRKYQEYFSKIVGHSNVMINTRNNSHHFWQPRRTSV
jgi:hypothetical protein